MPSVSSGSPAEEGAAGAGLAARLLDAGGPFAALIAGYAPRAAQIRMAELVEQAIADRATAVIEAGTGVGKTFAYLVPALLCGAKVFVSTGTRNLQDQLYHRDLPLVRRALGSTARVALLKGRSNYLCLDRLDAALAEGWTDPERAAQLQLVAQWAGRTRRGDLAEVEAVPEDSPLWPSVTSTADNCLGTECPRYEDCHVVKARREAQAADLVVINHHLLLADLALKEEGFGELLPSADAVIVDEAHQLPDTASAFFGLSLGSRQLLDLARDARRAGEEEAPDDTALGPSAQALEDAVRGLRLALGPAAQREPWRPAAMPPRVGAALATLGEALGALDEALSEAGERGRHLERGAARARLLAARLAMVREPPADHVAWYQAHRAGFAIQLTPLDVAEAFRSRMTARRAAWIFTSATVAVGGEFDYFAHRLGLEAPRTACLDSPFDYARNALLYLPPDLPEPNDPRHTAALVEAAMPVLAASRGRAFLLFTSHRALREAAAALRDRLPYPLLVQGEAPRGVLLARFRDAGDAVLLGTSSFWEGVDVRGEALSCVVIDRLPFASPGDPVIRARLDAIAEAGGDGFFELQLPQAVITLRQGVGRLIRDVADRGVLVIGDPRLTRRGYGRRFIASLPPMPLTRALADVETFFDDAAT